MPNFSCREFMYEEVYADTFVELLEGLEKWKLRNDNYDILNVRIRKHTNIYQYVAEITWLPCEENNE